MRLAALVVGLAACGRIGFEARSPGQDAAVPATCAFTRPLTITSASDALVGDYSVVVTFDHASLVAAGKALASGDDLQVTYNGIAVDRVLANGSTWANAATRVWFRLQQPIAAGASDGGYGLCYGTASTVPLADASQVFLLADDFSGATLDTTKWTVSDGAGGGVTVAEQNGELVIAGTNAPVDQYQTFAITSVQQFPADIAVETSFEIVAQSAAVQQEWKCAYGLVDSGMTTSQLLINSETNPDKRIEWFQTSSGAYIDVGDSTLQATTFGYQRLMQTFVASGTASAYENGVVRGTRSGLALMNRPVAFGYGPDYIGGGQTFDARFDDIVVRRFVASDAAISVTVGLEQ
jgi:hypothetical protein